MQYPWTGQGNLSVKVTKKSNGPNDVTRDNSSLQVVPVTSETRYDGRNNSPLPKPKKKQKSKKAKLHVNNYKLDMNDSQREMFYKGFDKD
jgi:hypothetical protein